MSPGDSPSRIAGCHWLRRNHPASSETLTFSMNNTLGHFVATRNWKTNPACEEAVDDATSLWKVEENQDPTLVGQSQATKIQ
jgi:hypothetical protein